ncbi:MAG: EAL domain-containing protein [Gammaproteobacteria bacterium]
MNTKAKSGRPRKKHAAVETPTFIVGIGASTGGLEALSNLIAALQLEESNAEDADITANRIAEVLAQPITVSGHAVYASASIGISLFPSDGESFNVSAEQFRRPNFPATVKRLIAHYRLDTDLLTLELTESALSRDVDQCLRLLRDLKALGVMLSIDDFRARLSAGQTDDRSRNGHAFEYDKTTLNPWKNSPASSASSHYLL